MAKGSRTSPLARPRLFIDRGEPLPRSYAENRIVAMVRSPEQIYFYWDVETEVRVAGSPAVVRVHCLSEGRSYDFEPGAEAENWYIRVTPNRTYRFELLEKRSGHLRRLATSDEVTTPIRWAGESGLRAPAEILHAVRHPIAREVAPPEKLITAVPEQRASETRAEPAPARAATAALHAAAIRTLPAAAPSPPPEPIPAPRERVFSADYVGGK